MVEEQIQGRRINHPQLIEAMLKTPRHLFVPQEQCESAYDDRALPIGSGQTISQPYMVALMTVALDPVPGMKVLEVGTGSGYQAAILAMMGVDLWTVERIAALSLRAQNLLTGLGLINVRFRIGDGSKGLAEGSPYDGILVTAGAPDLPSSLKGQLAEGGRLVIPTGSLGVQDLVVVTRRGDDYHEENHGACAFVPLVGEEGWKP
ncbi:MAG: protein-L-isoaspartate(D-aspartate) O-methyltransferase [Candidatus Eisenbacteria bacterium]|uniref:Protein-L-isoaspartate O-methyltransferase n=1 Tax=Eiseniibacteriota bacterium TaxID=2212470 RepID=A0A948WCW7_UNCEI|nr:protein-L-isoaspartate(D-aspartate) O-methyltransferase [Candidatus Eisenbacteria bacterium]MBU1948408.1 protein-L-isoaspartate(D-aspartate) O-methyltransferase [Candidatus Eisenbacteria bacterium]MBU2691298.1 protein-L-isoaspartate(D-aspartate) O-methyltransferase [Candidatus Eisenbacteria bacterium]